MAATFSHPFRLRPNGRIATVDTLSDSATSQALALLLLTVRGERKLAPSFGITDPGFRAVEPNEIAAAVAANGPAVRITDVSSRTVSDTTVEIEISYTSTEGPGGTIS